MDGSPCVDPRRTTSTSPSVCCRATAPISLSRSTLSRHSSRAGGPRGPVALALPSDTCRRSIAGSREQAEKERLKRFLFTRTDGFKTSGPMGRTALEAYGVDPERIHVVTQSVDVELWQAGRSRWRPERARLREQYGATGTTFLYVGRLWRGKGVDHLLSAYERLRELDTSLLIAGDGVDEPALRAQVAERGLRNVRFLGFKGHDELPQVYAAADVLVFPTLGDPNGLVVEEAMASGLPVISTEAAGDIRLRLPEGVAGYVVPPASPEMLADRMRMMARDPAATGRMARRPRRSPGRAATPATLRTSSGSWSESSRCPRSAATSPRRRGTSWALLDSVREPL